MLARSTVIVAMMILLSAPITARAQETTTPPSTAPATVTVFVAPSLVAGVRAVLDRAAARGVGPADLTTRGPEGGAEIAVTTRGLDTFPTYERAVGRAVYVPVAHFACPVDSIPTWRLKAIFAGHKMFWSAVGGPHRRVVPVMAAPGGRPDPLALAALGLPAARRVRFVATATRAADSAASRPGVLALVPIQNVNVRVKPLAVGRIQALANGASYPLVARVIVERTHQPAAAVDTSTPDASSTPAAARERLITDLRALLVSALVRPGPAKTLTIAAVGDVMLSRHVLAMSYALGDWRFPFRRTAPILRSANVAFGNLESPFSDRGGPVLSGMSFKADPNQVSALTYAGFDVMSLANNHFGNQGRHGMHYTFGHLKDAGIAYCGAGPDYRAAHTAAVVERDRTKIAFLSYNEIGPSDYAARRGTAGVAWMQSPRQIAQDIRAARARADTVIVSYHWGTEYTLHPAARQRRYASLAIDAGADAVLSQHPHVVQAIGWHKGRFVAYSLGNFVFDQMWSEATRQGLIAHICVLDGRVAGVTLTPTIIEDYGRPRLARRGEAASILGRIYGASGVRRW